MTNQTANRVFVVDDDDRTCSALARLLRAYGYHVECFDSPQVLLQRADLASIPTCLILDLTLPEMSGLEVQRRLDRLVPVIVLTAHDDVASSVEAMKAGALDFLVKPVSEAQLLTAVEMAVKHACGEHRQRKVIAEIEERMSHLTPREREVLQLVFAGRLNKQIAGDLGTSEKTVKIHRARVMEKMKARTIVDLIRLVSQVCAREDGDSVNT